MASNLVKTLFLGLVTLGFCVPCTLSAATVSGAILDLNGKPVSGALIIVQPDYDGPSAVGVFSDEQGRFQLPPQNKLKKSSNLRVDVRSLSHELVNTKLNFISNKEAQLTVIVKSVSNQALSVPASAWLGQAADRETVTTFILDCIGCHQVPSAEFINYTHLIADIPGDDRKEINRLSWEAMVKYMNFLSAEEFGRGINPVPPDAHSVYQVGDGERVVNFLSQHFSEPMKSIAGYSWGAPLATTPKTTIYEYEIGHHSDGKNNAVREALLLGDPKKLYVADVATNIIFKVDLESGKQVPLTIPGLSNLQQMDIGPHSLHRGADGSLWMAPFVSSVVAHLDVEKEEWRTWGMKDVNGKNTAIHDLSFGADHTLLTGKDGNIWFSDVVNNSVGYLDPDSGKIEIFSVPEEPGRPSNQAALYGLVMESNREKIWYTQLGTGSFGRFNILTQQFEKAVHLPKNSGPRRLTITDKDILYVPLYASGQLIEYDTKTDRQLGIYDLPDTASAPYAVTWDPVRDVVWIPTSNGDVIYRFDCKTKTFSALPMPRKGALLRMIDVDPDTGWLITSYANIVANVHGPRMALIIDPGDGAYEARKTAVGQH